MNASEVERIINMRRFLLGICLSLIVAGSTVQDSEPQGAKAAEF